MPDVIVPVTRAQQENDAFCGPATAQMVLAALNVATPKIPPSWQQQLWTYITQNTGAARPKNAPYDPYAFPQQKCEWCGGWECWGTTPGVLTTLLNTSQAVGQYSISSNTTEENATGALLDTIDQQLPGVALVYGWLHWLVVDGYKHGGSNPTPVAGRLLKGVYIRNPAKGKTTHYVTWSKWEADYMLHIDCGAYDKKIIVLSGRRLGTPIISPIVAPTAHSQPLVATSSLDTRDPWTLPMKTLLTPEAALSKAAGQIDEVISPRFARAMTSARPQSAQLVQRLDHPDRYYYIVTFAVGSRETARAIVDGFDGTMEEVDGIENEDDSLPRYLAAPVAVERLLAETTQLPDVLRYRVRQGTVGEHPVLVWKPCFESRSPFLPFYQLSVGDSFVYYRVDGEQFDALTTRPA